MEYKIISTGSKGNAVVVDGHILIDCGVPFRRLESVYRDLDAVLLTHIDILCTLVESPHVESKTALAALESVADMRDKRLNDCEDDTDEE